VILAQDYATAGLGNVFCAYAQESAPNSYTATVAQGGPLIWNGSALGGGKGVTAYILSISFGVTAASTVAGLLGLTGAIGQPAAPTATTAITKSGNLNLIGNASQCTPYLLGTVNNSGQFFLPVAMIETGAVTTQTGFENFVDIDGAIVVPINAWAAACGNVTLTGAGLGIGVVWAEVPN
jgi:hypothetical protein